MLHRVLRGVPDGQRGGAGEDKGTDLFDALTLDLEWWTQWDMASEDYSDILQFTEDYTGCAVDGGGDRGGDDGMHAGIHERMLGYMRG